MLTPCVIRFLGLPDLGAIFGNGGMDLPKIDVAKSIASLNTTLGGLLPPVPPEVISKLQTVIDDIEASIENGAGGHGGSKGGNAFASTKFNAHAAQNFGLPEDFEMPTWLMNLLQQLIQLLTQLGGGVRATIFGLGEER
jgi:hypothetical protein